MVTFQRDDKKMVVRNIRNLASLQSIYMEIYTRQLKNQDAELDNIMQQILSTQQFAYKMYLSCMLQLRPQTDIGTLSELDQQILLLLLSEFNRTDCMDSDEREKLQQYNRNVTNALCIQRPMGNLNPEQLEKVESPEVFYRCVLEQCATTSRLEPLQIPDNVADAIQWLDISDRKKESTLAAVKTELNDCGILFFTEKYKESKPIFDEADFELAEDIPYDLSDEELVMQESDLQTETTDKKESISPFQNLISLIQSYVAKGMWGKSLLNKDKEAEKNKQIAKILPTICPVSKTVVEITKLEKGHLVFTTSALYWVTGNDTKKILYADIQPEYLGTRVTDKGTAFVYAPPGKDQVEIADSSFSSSSNAELLGKLLSTICEDGEYAETDVLTAFTALPQEIQITYMQLLANMVRERGYSLHEVYRLAVQYGLHEQWDYISTEMDQLIEDSLREFALQIPYPNEEAIAIELLKDICTVYQYTKDSEILTTPEKKYFPLIFKGSDSDRDKLILCVQAEKQIIEKQIDVKSALATANEISEGVGEAIEFAGSFIPGVRSLISMSVLVGVHAAASDALSSKCEKQISEVDSRQKIVEKVMTSYRKAENVAKDQALAEFSQLLNQSANIIANRVGCRYDEYTTLEQSMLRDIRAEIFKFMSTEKNIKSWVSAWNFSDELCQNVLSNLTFSSSNETRDRMIGAYGLKNNMGMLFMYDCFYFRKNDSSPIQKMFYKDMIKVEEKFASIIVHGQSGNKVTINGTAYSRLAGLLQKITKIVRW